MAVPPLPYPEYLTNPVGWTSESVQTTIEAGSDIHRQPVGFHPVIDRATFTWVAPPTIIAEIKVLLADTHNLVGIYAATQPVVGEVHVQPEGTLAWTQTSMSRWKLTVPMRVV